MTNPTYSYVPGTNDWKADRYRTMPLIELANGSFVNVSHGTPMPVGIADDQAVLGRVRNLRVSNKFARRTGLTAANSWETVWELTTGNWSPMRTAEAFTLVYNSSTDGAGTSGALTVLVIYLDAAGQRQTIIHTLSNTGSDALGISGIGIHRVAVASNGGDQQNNSAITITTPTYGTQAICPAGDGVTSQSMFFSESDGYSIIKNFFIQVGTKESGGGNPRVEVRGRVYNRSVDGWYVIYGPFIVNTSTEQTLKLENENFPLSPADNLVWEANTDSNGATINVRYRINEYFTP